MTVTGNQYQYIQFKDGFVHPERDHRCAFKDTVTNKNYLMQAKPQGSSTNALPMSSGKLHARKWFLIHATLGLPINIALTAYKIVARTVKIISCVLPIPLGLSLKERVETIKEGFKFIKLQSFVLVAREAMNVYGIFKPFEATVWFADHRLSGVDGGLIYQAYDDQGFSMETMTDQEIEQKLNTLFVDAYRIDIGESDEGELRQDLILEANAQNDTLISDGKLVELRQVLRNMPNLRLLSLKNFGFINKWGTTVACLFPLVVPDRQPHLEEIVIKEPQHTIHALPERESVQAFFDSNPQFKRLEITISQASINTHNARNDLNVGQKGIEKKSIDGTGAFTKVMNMGLKNVKTTVFSFYTQDDVDSPENSDGDASAGNLVHQVTFERHEY